MTTYDLGGVGAIAAFFRLPADDTLYVAVQRHSDISTNGSVGKGDILLSSGSHGGGIVAVAVDTGDGRRVIIPWEDITGITVMDRREGDGAPTPPPT